MVDLWGGGVGVLTSGGRRRGRGCRAHSMGKTWPEKESWWANAPCF